MSEITFYRRSFDSEVWHFRPECPLYPADHFDLHSELPTFGILCAECATLAGRIAKPAASATRASDLETSYDRQNLRA